MIYRGEEVLQETVPPEEASQIAALTVKRRFSHMLHSKKRRAQKNEIRLKVLT